MEYGHVGPLQRPAGFLLVLLMATGMKVPVEGFALSQGSPWRFGHAEGDTVGDFRESSRFDDWFSADVGDLWMTSGGGGDRVPRSCDAHKIREMLMSACGGAGMQKRSALGATGNGGGSSTTPVLMNLIVVEYYFPPFSAAQSIPFSSMPAQFATGGMADLHTNSNTGMGVAHAPGKGVSSVEESNGSGFRQKITQYPVHLNPNQFQPSSSSPDPFHLSSPWVLEHHHSNLAGTGFILLLENPAAPQQFPPGFLPPIQNSNPYLMEALIREMPRRAPGTDKQQEIRRIKEKCCSLDGCTHSDFYHLC